jgi:hypothetical protein
VLFLRDPDGKVFDHIVPQLAVAVAGTATAGAVAAAGANTAAATTDAAEGIPSSAPAPPVAQPRTEPAGNPDVATAAAMGTAAAATATGNPVADADSAEVLAALRAPADETTTPTAESLAEPAAAAHPATEPLPAASEPPATAGSGASTTPPETVRIPAPRTPPPNRFLGRIVAVVLVLGLLGYLGWWFTQNRVTDNGTVTPPTTTSETTAAETTTSEAPPVVSKQVTVPGNTAWTDAGVACQPGKSIELNAHGTVFHAPGDGVGPDGDTRASVRQFNLSGLPDANHGALVASLDAKAPFTVIGGSATYQCQAAGELFLGPNDAGVDNNSGEWSVTVTPSG